MLDIYTCIISCIVFSDLVPTYIFLKLTLETHMACIILTTWYFWITMLFYFVNSSSCDLVIMLHDSYLSRTFYIHYIHVTLCMHNLLVHDLSSWLFLLLLLLSVLDTAKHIMLMSYLLFYIFIFSLWSFVFLRVLLLVHFWRTFYIIFQYLDQKVGIESCS